MRESIVLATLFSPTPQTLEAAEQPRKASISKIPCNAANAFVLMLLLFSPLSLNEAELKKKKSNICSERCGSHAMVMLQPLNDEKRYSLRDTFSCKWYSYVRE